MTPGICLVTEGLCVGNTSCKFNWSLLCAQVLNYKPPEKSFATVLPFHKIKIKVENFSLMVITALYLVEYAA